MALISFDDFLFPRERYSITPFGYNRHPYYNQPSGVLSSVFGDGFRELQRLERELGHLERGTAKSDPNSLSFRCNVAGYRPEELKVDMEGNQLVIHGEHVNEDEGQSIHRTFTRRVNLPEGVERDSIECNLNEKGQLEVKVQRPAVEETKKHNIPIGFKQSNAVQNDSTDKTKMAENGKSK